MLLHKTRRWILSPLEQVESPMLEDWQRCAETNGCTPEQIVLVMDRCRELYPAYELPVCRQYALHYDAPLHANGCALVYCEMDVAHLAAAQKDPRLVIFSSLDDPVDQSILDNHAHLIEPADRQALAASSQYNGRPARLREVLAALSARHVNFCASE